MNYLVTHQWIFILAAIWTLPWKGVALWKAARREDKVWFIILLVINTLGILEIIYIFLVARKPRNGEKNSSEPEKNETKVIDVKKV